MNELEKHVNNLNSHMGHMLDNFVRGSLMSDEFLNFLQENTKPLDRMMAYYRCAIMEVETKFKVLNEQFSLEYDRNPIESIKTRVKSMESIVKKVRARNIPLTLQAIEENITDIAGVRVVCSFPDDIYLLADCLLQQDDIRLIQRKDYIKHPKESGYRSLHLIVAVPIFLQNEKREMKVEVQLRTIAMDFWASLEHKVRYKKNIPADEADRLASELTECAHMSAELDRRMQSIRDRLASAEERDENNEKMEAQLLLSSLREFSNL
jgi:putative GTP pyrophosphokinase